jgi:hypothetical protein
MVVCGWLLEPAKGASIGWQGGVLLVYFVLRVCLGEDLCHTPGIAGGCGRPQ